MSNTTPKMKRWDVRWRGTATGVINVAAFSAEHAMGKVAAGEYDAGRDCSLGELKYDITEVVSAKPDESDE